MTGENPAQEHTATTATPPDKPHKSPNWRGSLTQLSDVELDEYTQTHCSSHIERNFITWATRGERHLRKNARWWLLLLAQASIVVIVGALVVLARLSLAHLNRFLTPALLTFFTAMLLFACAFLLLVAFRLQGDGVAASARKKSN